MKQYFAIVVFLMLASCTDQYMVEEMVGDPSAMTPATAREIERYI